MIKRIKVIKNIGTFSDIKGGKIQFEPLTLIFGLNSYGKSTLTDIFRSLSKQDPTILQNRKTIPSRFSDNQNIKISYQNESEEKNIFFEQSNWKLNNFNSDIQIFDSRFINNNVFTGLNITRDNKEKITDFILGEENVKKAFELASLKKEKRTLQTDKKRLEDRVNETIFEYGIDIRQFYKIQVDSRKDEIQTEIDSLTNRKINLDNKIKNADSIIKKKEPLISKIEINIINLLEKLNFILKKDFAEINEEAFTKLSKHIENNFKKRDNKEEKWIEKGLSDYLKDSNCPFCGQIIKDFELIEIYNKCFDESLKEFEEETKTELNLLLNKLIDENNYLTLKYKDNIILLKEYLPIIDESDFNKELEELELLSEKLDKTFQELKNELNISISNLRKTIEKKNQKPYEVIKEYDYLNFLEKNTSFIEVQEDYFLKEKCLIQKIRNFKESLQNDEIKDELKMINEEILRNNLKKMRLVNKPFFQKLIELTKKINKINEEINLKTSELEKEQGKFLKDYFDNISLFFRKFGSNEYQITKSISKIGYKPVISIHLKYKNVKVTDKNISYVLSDSERRALALSIFWAKLITKTNDEKKNTIIILDDPITSFDNNKMLKTIGEIFNINSDFRQIIILSHYEKFLKKILECNNNAHRYKLLKIIRDHKTSFLKEVEKEFFILTEHEKAFVKIESFIKRENNNNISSILRPFLETEIKYRFRRQILDNQLDKSDLKQIIKGLYENELLNETTKDYVNSNFRIILNPEHHKLSEQNPEDIKTLAQDMMEFIYNDLVPNKKPK